MMLDRFIPYGDKMEHVLCSMTVFLIIFFVARSFFSELNLYVFSFLLTLLIGALEEIRQVKIKKRECDMKDWIADFLGTTIGLLIALFVL